MSDSQSPEKIIQILQQENTLEAKLKAIHQLSQLPVTENLIQDLLQVLRQPSPSQIHRGIVSFLGTLAPLKNYPHLKFDIRDTLNFVSQEADADLKTACQKTLSKYPQESEAFDILRTVILVLLIGLGFLVLLVSACFFIVMSGPH